MPRVKTIEEPGWEALAAIVNGHGCDSVENRLQVGSVHKTIYRGQMERVNQLVDQRNQAMWVMFGLSMKRTREEDGGPSGWGDSALRRLVGGAWDYANWMLYEAGVAILTTDGERSADHWCECGERDRAGTFYWEVVAKPGEHTRAHGWGCRNCRGVTQVG